MSSSPTPLLFAAALALVAAAPAWAQPHPGSVTVHEPSPLQPHHQMKSTAVQFADLNLQTQQGADAAIQRLRAAAKRVCAPRPHSREVRAMDDYQSCIKGAMQDGVTSINNPAVQAAFDRAH